MHKVGCFTVAIKFHKKTTPSICPAPSFFTFFLVYSSKYHPDTGLVSFNAVGFFKGLKKSHE